MNRIIWLDNLKGVLILLVVLGHAIQAINPVSFQQDPLFLFIYSFHMPLFMFVSGYACSRAKVEWGWLKRRFKQLIIPYTIWSFVACLISGHYRLWEMFIYPERSLWFLYILYFVNIFHFVCLQLYQKVRIREEFIVTIFAVVLLGLSTIIPFGAVFLIGKYFVFYCLGFYLRKYLIIDKFNVYYSVSSVFLFLVVAYLSFNNPSYFLSLETVYKYSISIALSFLGILSFMLFFLKMLPQRISFLTGLGGG